MYDLKTINEKEASLNYYPRPQLKRSIEEGLYLNLNGLWEYTITSEFSINDIHNYRFNEIVVPYPIESSLSKVGKRLGKNDLLIYKKEFHFSKKNELVILHIGACASESIIYLNGKLIGNNKGGYLPFSFDITSFCKDDNTLVIICSNDLNGKTPYGKSCEKNHGIWYTPNSGIWKSVWIESVNKNYIRNIKIDTNNNQLLLNIDSDYTNYNIKILYNNDVIYNNHFNNNDICIEIDSPKYWSPDGPNLYDLIIENEYDYIESYFGLKDIMIKGNQVYLNGKRIYMHGLLDQGYYPESLLSYPNINCVEEEIKRIKELGFNTLRKHIKVEDDIWYYYCDKLGIIVWQDFVNMFRYSFTLDSALPTVLWKRPNRLRFYSKKDKNFFVSHSINIMNHLHNHPSICLWTIFNEGWGQFDTNKVYNIIRNNDSKLLIDSASGWFKCGKEEMISGHIYFKKIDIKKKTNKPYFLSEFGGYALQIKDHVYNDKAFGYKTFDDYDSYNNAIYDLYKNEIIPNIKKGLCASIYTQVSDIEDEINGIFTYDRKVCKLDKNIALKIKKEIEEEFNKYEEL